MARVSFLALFPKGPILVSSFIPHSSLIWVHWVGPAQLAERVSETINCWGCHWRRWLGEVTESSLLKKGFYGEFILSYCQITSTDRGVWKNSAAVRAYSWTLASSPISGQEPTRCPLSLLLEGIPCALEYFVFSQLFTKLLAAPFCLLLDRLLAKIPSRILEKGVGTDCYSGIEGGWLKEEKPHWDWGIDFLALRWPPQHLKRVSWSSDSVPHNRKFAENT